MNFLDICYSIYSETLISSDSKWLTEIVFVVKLQTLHEISHQKIHLENLTGEPNATNIN